MTMQRFIPLDSTLENHFWKPRSTYSHSMQSYLVAVAEPEVGLVLQTLPMAFVQTDQKSWDLCALLGVTHGQNLLVDSQGEWRTGHVPSSLQAWPFKLVAQGNGGPYALAIEEGHLHGPDSRAEGLLPIKTETGAWHDGLIRASQQIQLLTHALSRTQAACNALAAAQLLEPWPLVFETCSEAPLSGLWRLSEERIAGLLDPEILLKLHTTGALRLGWAQVFSMSQVHVLARLHRDRTIAAQQPPGGQLDLSFLSMG